MPADKTLFAGFGGQGVLMMGFCLASAAMAEDKHVTYMPSYGAEVRGGTANCTICIDTEEIASPIASSPDCLVALNEPSLVRFQNTIKPGGLCISNATLISIKLPRSDVREFRIPAGEIAEAAGSLRSANMVILGAFAAATGAVSLDTLQQTVENITAKKRKDLADMNRKAILAGYEFVKNLMKEEAARKKTSLAKAKKAVPKKKNVAQKNKKKNGPDYYLPG